MEYINNCGKKINISPFLFTLAHIKLIIQNLHLDLN